MSFGNRAIEVICNNPRALKNDLRDEKTMAEFKAELEKIGSVHRVITTEDGIVVVFLTPQLADVAHQAGEVSFQGERLKLRKRARSRSRSSSCRSSVIDHQLQTFVEKEKLDESCADRMSKLPNSMKLKVMNGTYDKGNTNMSPMVMGYITHLQRLESNNKNGRNIEAKSKSNRQDGKKFYGKLIELKDKFGFVRCVDLDNITNKKDIFLHLNDNPRISQKDIGHKLEFIFHMTPTGGQGRHARRSRSCSHERRHEKHPRSSSRRGRSGHRSKGRSGSRKRHRSRSFSWRSRAERKLKSAARDQLSETPEEYHARKLQEFIDLNRLDERSRRELRDSSLATQQDVMEQGFFIPPKSGRTSSQVVGGRIRTSRRARIGGLGTEPPDFRSMSPHREPRESSSSSSSSSSVQLARSRSGSRKSRASISASTRNSSPHNTNVRLRVTNIPKLPSDPAKYLLELFTPYLAMLECATGYKPIKSAWMKGRSCLLEIPNFEVAESAQRILHELPLMHQLIDVELLDAYV